ncbi:hypothetical protein [Nocardia vermiculata]|uniref:DUF222 domain-containing protein n=1 Tax=Nocardia vermiculata TaxID=257274 RepID=A0A846Y3R8_9NOCA|nr:hypothetical protein [Nocardia vermiculata]NKY51918.1 hypothetical protein [Nocardia vermiculata]
MFDGGELQTMSHEVLVDALRRAHGAAAFAQAAEVRAVRELYRRHLDGCPAGGAETGVGMPTEMSVAVVAEERAAAEISNAVQMSEQRAATLIDIGLALDSLPGTRDAFGDGKLDLARVHVIVEQVRGLPGELLAELEPPLVEAAVRTTPAGLRRTAQRWLAGRSTTESDRRREQHDDYRDVRRPTTPLPRRVRRRGSPLTAAADSTCGRTTFE